MDRATGSRHAAQAKLPKTRCPKQAAQNDRLKNLLRKQPALHTLPFTLCPSHAALHKPSPLARGALTIAQVFPISQTLGAMTAAVQAALFFRHVVRTSAPPALAP